MLSAALKSSAHRGAQSLSFRNYYHLDEFYDGTKANDGLPEHMHMLRHIYRCLTDTPSRVLQRMTDCFFICPELRSSRTRRFR